MNNQPLGVCLLSCVRHQGEYAPLYAENAELRIVCVADEADIPAWMRRVNQEFARRYHVPYLPVDEALARPDVDLVSICSEPVRHARLAIQSARAGAHVLVDKPMATTAVEAGQLSETIREAKVKLTYVHHLFNPALVKARQIIDEGRLAVPLAFHFDVIAGGGLDSGAVEDFSMVVDPALSGGGELMNWLNYPIGYLRFLTGLEVVSVYALAGTYFFEPHRQFKVEDLGLIALNLEQGVTATVTAGRVPVQIGASWGSFTLRGQGAYGLFHFDQAQPQIVVEKAAGKNRVSYAPPPGRPAGLEALINDLIHSIRTGTEPRCRVDDGAAISQVVEAVYRSLESGQVELI